MRKRMRYFVTFLVGTTDPKRKTWTFKTRAERLAFMHGAEAAVGYSEFELVKMWENRDA